MHTMSMSEFRKLDREGIKSILPVLLTFDGAPLCVASSPDGVIVIEDLHPRVRNALKAQEKKARGGLPPPEKLFAVDVKTPGFDTVIVHEIQG